MPTHTDFAAHDMPMVVYPGYLAGPGDQHTVFDTLCTFAKEREDWSLLADDGLVAWHNSNAASIELDLAEDAEDERWIILSARATLDNLWRVAFDVRTPAEVVMAAARRLAFALDQSTATEREQRPWSHEAHAATAEALRAEAGRANWSPNCARGCTATLLAPDGTASLQLRDTENDPVPGRVGFVLRAGARGHEENWWTAEFGLAVPTDIVLAVLRTVTDPGRYTRRASQIPMLHRPLLRTHPVTRPRPEPAHGR
ncbi:hypothetical protein KV557_00100 [Kitasatospora aureofaciens]|uniref:hypothetical protein n=1 Tax=Kitasatospora aureofaciens TaxID=1894 RepID=UPI001C47C423|nr:hypothetical protein [Kitasatospora aureofaciens]MBV6695527.1 hypothetical protein [Kitasatospora aureofaciens]